jgi:nitroimidazol reductase NimA-like FMN-containing flavoprotein (pyridoxamine 5'-phosphate oxidase superfamily)
LKRASLARLGTAHDNQPYVVPIHIYFDGTYLYSFSTLGRKIDWMRENPKVCVEVEEVADKFNWITVVATGRYDELVHAPSYEVFRQRARELFKGREEWWQPAATQSRPHDFRMPVIYRIRIETLTGRISWRENKEGNGGTERKPWWLDLMFEPVRSADD